MEDLFELIGLELTPEDLKVPNNQPRIVSFTMGGENPVVQPVFITGDQWDLLYWIWRLQDTRMEFHQMLAEFIGELKK